jgi:hypothetical protein
MSIKQYADLDMLSVSKILNLPTPATDTEPATKAYVDSAVEGLAWKDSCRVASISNINLSSPGATIDGVTMSVGDRVLVKDQTTASQNGIYIWNGAAVAMTRALDASTSAELEQAISTVEEGTSAGATFRQTNVNFVLDTGSVTWGSFGTSAGAASETVAGIAELATQAETDTGSDDLRIVTPLKLANHSNRKRKATLTFGDGSATSYAMTHNFGTRDCHVQVYRNSTPWDTIQCDMERTDANTVTLKFSVAPSSNQFIAVAIA